jgi:hypothetical protein
MRSASCRDLRSVALHAAPAVIVLLASCAHAAAQSCPYTPAIGTPERKAIMDALRAPVESELKQKVKFVAQRLTACRGWAFLEATPQRPDGQPVDWAITPYRDAVAADMCGGGVDALLVQEGGGWHVREYVTCATDVPWVGWAQQYGAPPELFPSLD